MPQLPLAALTKVSWLTTQGQFQNALHRKYIVTLQFFKIAVIECVGGTMQSSVLFLEAVQSVLNVFEGY